MAWAVTTIFSNCTRTHPALRSVASRYGQPIDRKQNRVTVRSWPDADDNLTIEKDSNNGAANIASDRHRVDRTRHPCSVVWLTKLVVDRIGGWAYRVHLAA